MITSEMRKHAPQTIEELVQQKYTLYIPPDYLDLTKPNSLVVSSMKNYKR